MFSMQVALIFLIKRKVKSFQIFSLFIGKKVTEGKKNVQRKKVG